MSAPMHANNTCLEIYMVALQNIVFEVKTHGDLRAPNVSEPQRQPIA